MNSNIISLLEEDTIKTLFNYVIEEDKKDYSINKNLIIIQIKKLLNKDKIIYTATLRDKNCKYNGFLFTELNPNEELNENTLINIEIISPRIFSKNQSRIFLVKKYKIISEDFNINFLPEPILIKEENGIIFSSNNNNIDNNINNNNNDNSLKYNDEMLMYTSLKHLTTFSRDFLIYVRIIRKSEIKVFNSNNLNNPKSGKLFYFIILDKDENEMQCTCFNKAVDKFYNVITEGKIYEIKGGYVKINDRKYTNIKSDYKIVLDENSKITEKKDNGRIKANKLNVTKIKDIEKLNIYSIIDLCAVVLEIGEISIKHTRNGDQPMKKILIGDISKHKIEFSLWRIHSSINIKNSDILLIKNAKIGIFNGKNLSTFDDTSIQINPSNSIKEVSELENFIKNYKGEYDELSNYNDINPIQNKDKMNEKYDTVYIKDSLDSIDTIDDVISVSKICATVTQIIHNEKNYYLGCADFNCKRKLIYEENKNIYICPNCKKNYDVPHYYYTLSLRIKDASCEHWIDIFGKTAESIMKISAEEYCNILKEKNQSKLKEISKMIEFKQFNFWCKPKLQMYNMYSNSSKKKLYAYKIEPIDHLVESKKVIKYIKALLNIHS